MSIVIDLEKGKSILTDILLGLKSTTFLEILEENHVADIEYSNAAQLIQWSHRILEAVHKNQLMAFAKNGYQLDTDDIASSNSITEQLKDLKHSGDPTITQLNEEIHAIITHIKNITTFEINENADIEENQEENDIGLERTTLESYKCPECDSRNSIYSRENMNDIICTECNCIWHLDGFEANQPCIGLFADCSICCEYH